LKDENEWKWEGKEAVEVLSLNLLTTYFPLIIEFPSPTRSYPCLLLKISTIAKKQELWLETRQGVWGIKALAGAFPMVSMHRSAA
jgi:hypothetical protein